VKNRVYDYPSQRARQGEKPGYAFEQHFKDCDVERQSVRGANTDRYVTGLSRGRSTRENNLPAAKRRCRGPTLVFSTRVELSSPSKLQFYFFFGDFYRIHQLTIIMASSTPARLRSLYRSLLRELPPRPVLASPRAVTHQQLRDHFRPESSSTFPHHEPSAAVSQAEQYLAYLRSQRVYVELLERYNPGMNMDDEERVRLTARRVGMDLPVEFIPSERGKK